MNTTVTDDQIRQLTETAKPYSLALLRWGPERHMDGAEATELEHQRRMVSLRAEGVIAILCPVASETLAGVAIMNITPGEAREIMDEDPCVRTRMIPCMWRSRRPSHSRLYGSHCSPNLGASLDDLVVNTIHDPRGVVSTSTLHACASGVVGGGSHSDR